MAVFFAHSPVRWEALAERAILCNQCLSGCLSQCVTPCCQLAAGSRWVVTTFDLTASRNLGFYQLLPAPSAHLLFIPGTGWAPLFCFLCWDRKRVQMPHGFARRTPRTVLRVHQIPVVWERLTTQFVCCIQPCRDPVLQHCILILIS